MVDASQLGLSFQEAVAAQDALIAVGSLEAPTLGALASSATNEFESLVDGVSLTLGGTSNEAVSINIAQTVDPIG